MKTQKYFGAANIYFCTQNYPEANFYLKLSFFRNSCFISLLSGSIFPVGLLLRVRIIPKDNDDNTCRLNIGYFSDRKNIHFKSQVFSFPNTPLPSNADIFDLCAPSLNHLPLCRLLCRSLKASPHSNLVYSGSETEHKVAKRVDKS